MGFKTILVHCDASRGTAARIKLAVGLAERFDAHLICLHVREVFQAPTFTDAGPPMDSLYRAYETAATADQDIASAAFKDAVGTMAASSEWRVTDGYVEEVVIAQARFADLVVVGQADPDTPPTATPSDLPEKVAMASARPVVIVPHIGVSKPPGKTVMLCWNGGREAARAATSALPLLKAADKVIILIVDPKADADQGEPGADVAGWLAAMASR
jgi:nucleotide-binding universal stress UspA family protein